MPERSLLHAYVGKISFTRLERAARLSLHFDGMALYANKVTIDKSSSKPQIAAYLLMILAMAERGGFEPPVGVLAPTTV